MLIKKKTVHVLSDLSLKIYQGDRLQLWESLVLEKPPC